MGWVLLRHWCSCANVPKALHVSFESADACISAMTFNAFVAELFWFVEVMGSNANNAMVWRETFCVEDAWTFTPREWTILDNPLNDKIIEKEMWADMKLPGLAKCKCVFWGLAKHKCAFWFVMVVAETSDLEDHHNPLESRLIGVGICHWFLELLVAAIEWLISSSIPN